MASKLLAVLKLEAQMETISFQGEYLVCMQEEKLYLDSRLDFPVPKDSVCLEARGQQTEEKYLVDIANKSIQLRYKFTYQNRIQNTICLLRLDVGNHPHRNPDGEKITGNHMHIYLREYGDAYAVNLDDQRLLQINSDFDLARFKENDPILLFEAFSDFCRLKELPTIASSFSENYIN